MNPQLPRFIQYETEENVTLVNPSPVNDDRFLPIFSKKPIDKSEVLAVLHTVSKIEVSYPERDPKTGTHFTTTLKYGIDHPNASRVYKLFVGNKPVLLVRALVDCPLSEALWEILKNSTPLGDQGK
jgi:hypothetical protein